MNMQFNVHMSTYIICCKKARGGAYTSEVAEMCSASLELGVGAPVVLDGGAAGMCETRSTCDRRQWYVDVVTVSR